MNSVHLIAKVSNGIVYPHYSCACFPISRPAVHFWRKTNLVTMPCCATLSIHKSHMGSNFSCSASQGWKGKNIGGDLKVDKDLGSENTENDDDDDYWIDDEEETDDGEDVTPLDKRLWFERKPAGFGEGKKYDVSLEDKLLEEFEKNRNAYLASKRPKSNLNNAVKEVPLNGVRVRVGNLPKKKNIHRDLQVAFKEFKGINKISPAVSGNHKTRDPVCKGFAFLDLKSEEVAERFVKMFSNQSIIFGKVEKNITCHIMTPSSSGIENISSVSSDIDKELIEERYESEGMQPAEYIVSSSQVIDTEILSERLSGNVLNSVEENVLQRKEEKELGAFTSSQQNKPSINRPKSKGQKEKKQRKNEMRIPGAAIRLKGKERAVLSDVFTKYRGQVPSDPAKKT